METEQNLHNRIRDLEFLLRREKMDGRKRVKDVLYQILEFQDSLQKLLKISAKQDWQESAKKFTEERLGLLDKKLTQILLRSGAVQINSLGQPINPQYHEVMEKIYNPDTPEGNIVKVHEEGYIFENEVIRMAKVSIATSQK